MKPGEYYEDCNFHPCLCVRSKDDVIYGISLIDGSFPRCCDANHCGVIKLSFKQAMDRKFYGPPDPEVIARFPKDRRWWIEWRGSSDYPDYYLWREPKKRGQRP